MPWVTQSDQQTAETRQKGLDSCGRLAEEVPPARSVRESLTGPGVVGRLTAEIANSDR